MKKRFLTGLGLALLLASPIWVTMHDRPDYLSFVVSLTLGLLLLFLAAKTGRSR